MSTAIAIEELAYLGANTFLQVGSTNPIRDELAYGELVIAKGAVRWDGTSHDYVRPEYPALTHFEVTMAAISAAEHLGYLYKVGIIGDLASLGVERDGVFHSFLNKKTGEMRQALSEVGVLGVSGEAATLLVQSSIYGFRAGVVNINSFNNANPHRDSQVDDKAVRIGLEAMRILAAWDEGKRAKNRPFTLPEIIQE